MLANGGSWLIEENWGVKCYKKKILVFEKRGLYGDSEITILKKLQGHPNILRMYDSDHRKFMAEFLPFVFDRVLPDRLTPEMVRVVYTGVKRALDHCHASEIMHCDVAPPNIGTRNANIDNMQVDDIVLFDFNLSSVAHMIDGIPTSIDSMIGRYEFCSRRLQMNRERFNQPEDDFESLFYTCWVLEKGWMPWDSATQTGEELMQAKCRMIEGFYQNDFKTTALSECEVFSRPSREA